jgi:sugar-specific transcriptional regulator TrmB
MSLYTQALTDAGFTKHQASIYSYLVENGPSSASIIARQTSIARTLTYRVLDELAELGLCERDDKKGAVSVYTPAHPVKLHELVERRRKEAEQAATAVGSIVDTLTSEYNKTLGKPGVVFYEGEAGVRRVYEDTISNNRSGRVQVIRSYLDDKTLGAEFYKTYAQRRARNNIYTEIISPTSESHPSTLQDEDLHKIRRYMKNLKVPAEINIYDDKVAIIAFDEPLIGTIIEKKAVAETMRALFGYMWETLNQHEQDRHSVHRPTS